MQPLVGEAPDALDVAVAHDEKQVDTTGAVDVAPVVDVVERRVEVKEVLDGGNLSVVSAGRDRLGKRRRKALAENQHGFVVHSIGSAFI
jgi:hypothetical protein